MKRWTLALPLLLAAAPALAQEERTDFSFALAAPASTDECRLDIAEWVDFTDVLARGSALRGRCVAIDGYWRHAAFYGSRTDASRAQHGPWGALARRAIGIYADWDALGPYPSGAAQPATVVGIMGDCEHLAKELSNRNAMVLGFCHQHGGPFIRVAQMIRD